MSSHRELLMELMIDASDDDDQDAMDALADHYLPLLDKAFKQAPVIDVEKILTDGTASEVKE